MADRQDPDYLACREESIEGHVPCSTVRDDQLAEVTGNSAADERMMRQHPDGGLNCARGCNGGIGHFCCEKLKRSFEVRERVA